jgi:hypothetical protein
MIVCLVGYQSQANKHKTYVILTWVNDEYYGYDVTNAIHIFAFQFISKHQDADYLLRAARIPQISGCLSHFKISVLSLIYGLVPRTYFAC